MKLNQLTVTEALAGLKQKTVAKVIEGSAAKIAGTGENENA